MKAKFGSLLIDDVNRFDGKVYSLANTGLTMRLVYNKDLFAKAGIENPPKSLQEMVEDAKKITEVGKAEGIYGFALNFKNPKQAFDRSVREILSLSGYQGLGFDLKTGQFDFEPYSQVIDYFKQMHKDGSILPGAEALDIDPLRAQFAAGKIGMYLSFSTEPGVYMDQFPTEINWGAHWLQRWTVRSRELPKSCPPERGSASAPNRPIRKRLGNSCSICTAMRF